MRDSLSEAERKVIVLRVKRVARLAVLLGVSPMREPGNLNERKDQP